MLCERVLRNVAAEDGSLINDDAPGVPASDYLDLGWRECGRRALRKRSRGGREMTVLLPLGAMLRHGDVLSDGPAGRVIVNVMPGDVLIMRPRNPAEIGLLALELGNLHAPVEIGQTELITIPDGPVEALLARLGVPHATEVRRFCPARVVADGLTANVQLADGFTVGRTSRHVAAKTEAALRSLSA